MDRVWAAAEDHNMRVAIHGSFGSKLKSFARTRVTNQFYVHKNMFVVAKMSVSEKQYSEEPRKADARAPNRF